jgi:hypothetical protein
MEIRINLLPKTYSTKEKSSVFLIPVLGIVTVVFTAAILTYSYFDKKNSVQTLSDQIALQTTTRDNLLKEYQDTTVGVTPFNFAEKYKAMDDVLSSIYVNANVLHDGLKTRLPEKAEVTAYTYLNSGELTMTVNFFSKGDSAIYLDRLLNVPFVHEAQLISIAIDEETFRYDSTYELKLDTLVGVDQ